MRMLFLVIAVGAVSAFAGGAVTGGIAKAIGSGSDDINMGFNIEGSMFQDMAPNVALGGQLGYQRWGVDLSGVDAMYSEIDASISYLEILGIVRVSSVGEQSTLFFQPGVGYFSGTASVSYMGQSDSHTEGDVGISLQAGADINKFEIMPGFKCVFTDGETTKWINISVGLKF